MFLCVRRTRSLVCAALFKARRGMFASFSASAIPSVSPQRSAVVYAPAIPILPKDLRLLYILDGFGG
jgi:hypothetical protein